MIPGTLRLAGTIMQRAEGIEACFVDPCLRDKVSLHFGMCPVKRFSNLPQRANRVAEALEVTIDRSQTKLTHLRGRFGRALERFADHRIEVLIARHRPNEGARRPGTRAWRG